MGPSRKSQKSLMVPITRTTRNRSRHYKSKLITDTAQSTMQLTNQLRALGLYAAPTLGYRLTHLGDGNCLFRALSDQLWGSSSGHLKLRTEVCDWMSSQRERYEGFVDEDRTFDTHLKLMRLSGTYGGHLELSAFAHLKRRNVKVIQPGLVYVIEWNCGWSSDTGGGGGFTSSASVGPEVDDRCLNERDKRRLRREKKKISECNIKQRHEKKAGPMEVEEEAEQQSAVYVAYHDWEHFSSVRNLTGPHTGLPLVVERPPPKGYDDPSSPDAAPNTRSRGNAKPKLSSVTPSLPITVALPIPLEPHVLSATPSATISRSSSVSELDVTHLLTPAHIPLPPSRSISPPTSISDDVVLSPPVSQISTPSSQITHVSTTPASSVESRLSPTTVTVGSILAAAIRNGRSPKRTFDQTEDRGVSKSNDGLDEDGRCTPSSPKRHKLRSSGRCETSIHRQTIPAALVDTEQGITDVEDDNNNSTPSLSSDNSSQADSSSSSSAPPPSLVRALRSNSSFKKSATPEHAVVARQCTPTKRQARQAAVIAMQHTDGATLSKKATRAAKAAVRATEITGPSTRVLRSALSKSKASAIPSRASSANEEWQKNGSGRVDVRGFRELRI